MLHLWAGLHGRRAVRAGGDLPRRPVQLRFTLAACCHSACPQ